MIDPEWLGGFLGFLQFETCRCPNCGEVLTREEVVRRANRDNETFVCPRCSYRGDIAELEDSIQ